MSCSTSATMKSTSLVASTLAIRGADTAPVQTPMAGLPAARSDTRLSPGSSADGRPGERTSSHATTNPTGVRTAVFSTAVFMGSPFDRPSVASVASIRSPAHARTQRRPGPEGCELHSDHGANRAPGAVSLHLSVRCIPFPERRGAALTVECRTVDETGFGCRRSPCGSYGPITIIYLTYVALPSIRGVVRPRRTPLVDLGAAR